MLVCESMDACISVCMVAKSSIRCLSHSILSKTRTYMRLIVEFSPTYGTEDGGKLSPSLRWYGWGCHHRPWPKECHHVQDSGSTPRSRAAMTQRTKTTVSLAIYCHWSVNQSLGWTGQTRALTSLHSTTSSSRKAVVTTTHNNKYLAP
jgi:hypothetical protein